MPKTVDVPARESRLSGSMREMRTIRGIPVATCGRRSFDVETVLNRPSTFMPTPTYLCLIRGINVGGRNMVPMAELRQVCADLGWADVRTYIQSGNLIFRSGTAPRILEAQLEHAVERRFGVTAAVLVRTVEEWQMYIKNNPYADACRREPNLVMLALSKALPSPDAVGALRNRASSGELVEQAGDAFWICYSGGAGRSKLSPGLLDRLVGSQVTTRNWRTVVKLGELAGIEQSART